MSCAIYADACFQQAVTAYGTAGSLSYWNPAVQTSGDFSLLQTGVINTQQIEQTAEAGWQVFQALNGDTASHLFTYYTVRPIHPSIHAKNHFLASPSKKGLLKSNNNAR